MEKDIKQKFIECLLKLKNDTLLLHNSNVNKQLKLEFGDPVISYNPMTGMYQLNGTDWEATMLDTCAVCDKIIEDNSEAFVNEVIDNYFVSVREIKGKNIPFTMLIDKFEQIIRSIDVYQTEQNIPQSDYGIYTKYYVFKVIENSLVYTKKPLKNNTLYDAITFQEVCVLKGIDYIDLYDALNVTYQKLKSDNIAIWQK